MTFLPRIWMQQDPPKHLCPSTKLHGITHQKILTVYLTTVLSVLLSLLSISTQLDCTTERIQRELILCPLQAYSSRGVVSGIQTVFPLRLIYSLEPHTNMFRAPSLDSCCSTSPKLCSFDSSRLNMFEFSCLTLAVHELRLCTSA
jgi:hypothetical protein